MAGILNILAAVKTGVAAAIDSYFNLTTLLLPGNGTNGAQNNTFLDSSSNNFSITRNGNTTQGTFSPFSQTGWSNYFAGSSTYLSAAANNAFSFGTGNFTIEAWVYPTVGSVYRGLFANGGVSTGSFAVYLTNTNTVRLDYYGGGGVGTTTTVALNTWSHIVVARSGSTISIFINGTREATATTSDNNTSNACYVGASWGGASDYMQGYISNLRVVKGTAVYDPSLTTLTVPTSPLTAITNTSLLTCQSNRFIDNSTNAFSITLTGSPSVQAFSPFAPTAAYSAATNGGSGYFDGTGDILSVASNAVFALPGDFTIEYWIYPTSFTNTRVLSVSTNGGFALWPNSSGYPVIDSFNVAAQLTSSIALKLNSWNHVCAVRSGTTMTIYVNGASGGSTTNSTSFVQGALYIGGDNFSYYTNGYLSGLRWVKGSANAPSGAPTAPPTAVTNTQLLLNFTNGGIIDATGKNVLETVGNAQISTTQSKFGGSSMYFDGTGDWLVGKSTELMSFGTGDFTVEMWIRPSSVSASDTNIIDTRNSGSDSGYDFYINNGTLKLYTSAGDRLNSSSTISANVWTHIAWVRSSGTLSVYINGTQSGTTTYTTSMTCPGKVFIGAGFDGAANYSGYIDDLRISKYARYSGSSFTVPSAPFALQ